MLASKWSQVCRKTWQILLLCRHACTICCSLAKLSLLLHVSRRCPLICSATRLAAHVQNASKTSMLEPADRLTSMASAKFNFAKSADSLRMFYEFLFRPRTVAWERPSRPRPRRRRRSRCRAAALWVAQGRWVRMCASPVQHNSMRAGQHRVPQLLVAPRRTQPHVPFFRNVRYFARRYLFYSLGCLGKTLVSTCACRDVSCVVQHVMSIIGALSSADAADSRFATISNSTACRSWQETSTPSALEKHQHDAVARMRRIEKVVRSSIKNLWERLLHEQRRVFMVGDSLMRDQATYVRKVLNISKVYYVAAGWKGNDSITSCKERQAQRGLNGQQKWHRYQQVPIGVAARCVSEVYNLTSRDVLLVNSGVHFNEISEYIRSIDSFLDWFSSAPQLERPCTLWRETLPQHWHHTNDGTYRNLNASNTRKLPYPCRSLSCRLQHGSRQKWNDLASPSMMRAGVPIVRVFDALVPHFLQHHSEHETSADCTHWTSASQFLVSLLINVQVHSSCELQPVDGGGL